MLIKRQEDPHRVVVNAAAARASGQILIEQQWAGVAETSPASGAKYALAFRGEYEVPFITGAVKGDTVFINTTTFALTRQAAGGTTPTGTLPFAKVSAVPGDGPDSNPAKEPLAGKMWIILLPPAQ